MAGRMYSKNQHVWCPIDSSQGRTTRRPYNNYHNNYTFSFCVLIFYSIFQMPGNDGQAVDGMTRQFGGMSVTKQGFYGARVRWLVLDIFKVYQPSGCACNANLSENLKCASTKFRLIYRESNRAIFYGCEKFCRSKRSTHPAYICHRNYHLTATATQSELHSICFMIF